MRLLPGTLALFLILPRCALAQSAADDAPVKKLQLAAAAEPSPALKHRLLPILGEMRPGNAALLYQRAHSPEWFGALRRMPDFDKVHELLDLPLGKLPRDKAAALAMPHMLKEIDLAARRVNCDWEWLDRVRDDGFGLLIPDVQGFRTYGQLLSLRTRLRLIGSDYPQAVHSLQTHLALSRHVADAPILINVLVGNAIAGMALSDVEELIQLDGSPNLFWALADLPRPLISLRKALEGERMMIDVILPGIREALGDPSRPPLTVAQMEQGMKQLAFLGLGADRTSIKLGLTFVASRSYPAARDYLLDNGFTPAQVEAMPVLQVALMHGIVQYDRLYDEFAKWHNQPAWVARAGYRKCFKELIAAKTALDVSTIGTLIIPALEKVHDAQTRLDRRVAILQTIEAIRVHVSRTTSLPVALADIKDLPLPLDPETGQPFQYNLSGDKATLVAPVPPGMAAHAQNTMRYELSLRRK